MDIFEPLKESTTDDVETLGNQGYLFIKRAIPLEIVNRAKYNVANEYNLPQNLTIKNGDIGKRCIFNDDLASDESIINLTEYPSLVNFFKKTYGGKAATFKTKWFRIINTGEFTKKHADFTVDPEMYTCWIPLDNYNIDGGVLYLTDSNHILRASNVEAGDVIVFKSTIQHGSTINKTDKYRLSVESRWLSKPVEGGQFKEF